MEALECLRTRRSIRQYTPQPVDQKTLEQLIDVARLAPTANNRQPWDFVVVTDPGLLQQLAQATDWGKQIAQAAACIAVMVQPGTFAREDGANAATYITLAARALGLGSCWIAGEPSPAAGRVKALLGIPTGVHLTCLLSIGYPAENPTPEKRPLQSVLRWNRY